MITSLMEIRKLQRPHFFALYLRLSSGSHTAANNELRPTEHVSPHKATHSVAVTTRLPCEANSDPSLIPLVLLD
jgi:hypothetical protein